MSFYELAEKALKLEREGKKIIRLNVGDTNLPAPSCVIESAAKTMNNGKTNYGSSAGMQELREKIAQRENCDIENVVVGPGSKHIIYGLLTVLADKGDKVLLPSPTWPAYSMICKQLSLNSEIITTKLENNWDFGELDLSHSKIAIICNPGNPTSMVYDKKSIENTIKKAQDAGCNVILDEAYKALAFEKMPDYEGAIKVRSFSKEFNIANWRLGYAIAPSEVVKKLIAYNQINITCVPPFIQMAGIACIENEKQLIPENLKVWKSRSQTAQESLKKAGFKFAQPKSGIYLFATHDRIQDSAKYALDLLDKGVAIAPGSVFGGYNRFFRICINQDEEVLKQAIEILGSALK